MLVCKNFSSGEGRGKANSETEQVPGQSEPVPSRAEPQAALLGGGALGGLVLENIGPEQKGMAAFRTLPRTGKRKAPQKEGREESVFTQLPDQVGCFGGRGQGARGPRHPPSSLTLLGMPTLFMDMSIM